MHINWFPGHMAKAQRMIREQLKLVDVAIELLDARIPAASANPVIDEVVGDKPRVVVLNKADLAEPEGTERWLAFFRAAGREAIAVESLGGGGTKQLAARVEKAAAPMLAKLAAKGIRPRAVRAMILGIPNVGKSSLINRLLGTATVRTGDKPGVTRGQQWLKIGRNLELLDTPGVLWPKLEDQEAAFRLAITGAISDEVFDREKVVAVLLDMLRREYPDRLTARFNLTGPLPEDGLELLAQVGKRRGCLRGGGAVDYEKAGRIVLSEFRDGKLGRYTLDYPPE
ncbi:ribosome biogenesis GTPase YlqF [Anaeroselena agilis]|uniref:Ribosome biogenesis GTPase A n=1 Tax=Anaeroselena agilis TaxID=3063788 RepID=A0ABU3NYC2_9FIRM|nr:ribosome biogenesis GTPase YlqF [Selenomonadales bacterium 4137-cl]